MACLPCQGARQQFVRAATRFDLRGAAQAVTRGVAINVDKMRGVDVNAKYGTGQQPVVKATPYRRPPDRTA
jgi:hypothetical protein